MLLTKSRREQGAGNMFDESIRRRDRPASSRSGVEAVRETFVSREQPGIPDSSRPGEREVDPETGAVPTPPGVVEPRVGPPVAPPIPPPDYLPDPEPGRRG